MATLTRRDLLKLAGAATVLTGCANGAVLTENADLSTEGEPLGEALPVDDGAFPIGVMAGDATEAGIILISRYLGDKPVKARVWEDLPTGRRIWAEGVIGPDADGFLYLDVGQLGSDRAYRYAFMVADGRSPIGNFRTAPASDALAALTFAGTSCTHKRRWPLPVLSNAATRDLAFFVHNGDHVYTDADAPCLTREDFRKIYEANYRQSGMSALHQAFGFYGTWDDHEFEQNFNPEKYPKAQFEAGAGAYFEHVPVRRNGGRLWRSFRWGKTAEIFMLDCRSERKPSTRNTDKPQYISTAQMDWLKAGLADSPCQFKFIINSVPISHFGGVWDVEGYDRWDGYPRQRQELLDFISNGISGVWFCAGDFHLGAIGRAEKTGPHSAVREILWGPGGTIINVLHSTLSHDQWDHVIDENNYTMLTCDPASNTLRIRFVDVHGNNIVDVTYPNT